VNVLRRGRRGRPPRYDLVIIGMGSAGTVAAEAAAEDLGLRVAAIERARVGGDCLWTGCVPSKALLASARAVHAATHGEHLGIGTAGPPLVDAARVWRRIASVQDEIAATDDDPERFRQMGVDLIEGDAVVSGAHEVTIGPRTLDTRFVLVCTGSRPAIPPIEGIDDVGVLTSENLFTLERPPPSIVVIGGGPVACEVAQALNRLGVEVTQIEMADRLLPRDDRRHADRLLRTLVAEGVDVRLDRTVRRVADSTDRVAVELDTGETLAAAGLFVATGRVPNVDRLGLDRLGIDCAADGVVVDGRNRTSVRSIYVVGDANGRPDFTHAAAYDAVGAVRDMFLPGHGRAVEVVPWCTFTDPEVAHVGLTETEAIDRFGARHVEVRRRSLERSDRARADGSTDGEITIVIGRGRIVGGHAICPHAGELIHELAIAVSSRMRPLELARIIHVYPTLSTTIGQLAAESAHDAMRRYRAMARLGRLLR
jgi:pyruvate/2-oxoglutarate dehydrogenase complex dihydrolipoamide dehydrogenase (E3) component